MKRIFVFALASSLALASLASAQNTNSSTTTNTATNSNTNAAKKRGPVFRATKDQIKQAQTMLQTRSLYGGEITGKLNADTRAALRKFQEAEGIKVTGTLNRETLEKMSITLTEKQKAM